MVLPVAELASFFLLYSQGYCPEKLVVVCLLFARISLDLCPVFGYWRKKVWMLDSKRHL